MYFKQTTVAPAGRNKYGNYLSSGNVKRKVVSAVYGGDYSTNKIGDTGSSQDDKDKKKENDKNFLLFLGHTSGFFKGEEISLTPSTDSVQLFGFVGTAASQTYVSEITTATTEPAKYGIKGIPDSGMTVKVENNGESNTVIKITVDSSITQTIGTLSIPCNLNISDDVIEAYTASDETVITQWEAWSDSSGDCMTIWLEYQWSVSSNASSTYTLDLTNDSATINCDSAGTILAGAVRPTCEAGLYYGIDKIDTAVIQITTPASSSAVGVTCTTGGVVTFGDNFQFAGTSLEITFRASLNGTDVGIGKVMTITKLYPGKNGEYATSRWIVPNASTIKYDPNLYTIEPEYISAYVMAQKGEETPYKDTGTTIYYDYNTTTPSLVYSSGFRPNISYDYLCFALKNSAGTVYEAETIPIMKNGTNGKDGSSPYRLDLSNQNASINADKDGNILQGSTRPTCKATLYMGTTAVTGASYAISYPSQNVQGVKINGSTGEFTFSAGTASTPFTFDGNSLEITVTAAVNSVVVGTAVMTISKALAGQNGNDAVSYWLTLSADKVKVDPNLTSGNITPSVITATAYKQVGENTPVSASDCTIKYGYNTAAPTTNYTGTITVDGTKDYITFKLYKGTNTVDTETVPILGEGKNGTNGENGLKGASVRGPVNYYDQTTSRRFCNGSASTLYAEDGLWIDVILKDDVYYYCNTSYNGSASDTWSNVSKYWTKCDQQFNFVATNVLLAKNANINFLGSNQILLKDSSGNTTGGAIGGDGVNFWAGSSNPNSGIFQVTYDGKLKAKQGQFGNLVIGSGAKAWMSDGVSQEYEGYDDDFTFNNNMYLTHRGIFFNTYETDEDENSSTPSWIETEIDIVTDYSRADKNAPIYIRNHFSDDETTSDYTYTQEDRYRPCIEATGEIEAGSFILDQTWSGVTTQYSPVESIIRNLKVVFCVDSGVTPTLSGNTNGYLTVNGIETVVRKTYPLGSGFSFAKVTKTIQTNRKFPAWLIGHWVVMGTNAVCLPTGFADGSMITKQSDTLYIYLKTS